jgi:cell shape-determining protein MreC
MKKTYHRNKKTTSRRVVYAGGGILFLLVIGFFFSSASSIVRDMSSPFLNVGGALSRASASVFSSFFLGDAGARIATLENENEELRLSFEEVEEEKNRYGAMLGRYGITAGDEGVVFAGVLVAPPRSLYDTIVIDAGSRAGISQGAYVYVSHDRFIGSVVAVSLSTSLVELVSSPGNTVDVVFGTDHSVRAEAHGKGDGNLTVMLPRDVDIVEGEVVFLPGFSGAILGTVDVVETTPNDPFQEIRIRMNINMSELTDVAVLPPLMTEFPLYTPHVKRASDEKDEKELSEEGEYTDFEKETSNDKNTTSSDEEESAEAEASQE